MNSIMDRRSGQLCSVFSIVGRFRMVQFPLMFSFANRIKQKIKTFQEFQSYSLLLVFETRGQTHEKIKIGDPRAENFPLFSTSVIFSGQQTTKQNTRSGPEDVRFF